MREESRNLRLPQVRGMTLLMKFDEATDPPDVLLLGPVTVMPQPDRRPHLGQELHPAMLRRTSATAVPNLRDHPTRQRGQARASRDLARRPELGNRHRTDSRAALRDEAPMIVDLPQVIREVRDEVDQPLPRNDAMP